MTKKLLIVADDYGAHDSIDNGIIDCIKKGAIDCLDILVIHNDIEIRIEKLFRECHKELVVDKSVKIGLHLCLTSGIAQYREDADFLDFIEKNGKFKFDGKLNPIGFLLKTNRVEKYFLLPMELEMRAQYDKLVRLVSPYFTDFVPVHVSSHSGVYQATDDIYDLYAKFVNEKGMYMRCPTLISHEEHLDDLWDDNPKEKLYGFKGDVGGFFFRRKAEWVEDDAGKVFQQWRQGGLKSTEHFVEHFYKNGTVQDLRNIFSKIVEQDLYYGQKEVSFEMVVHPAKYQDKSELNDMPDGTGQRKSMDKRRSEWETLTGINTLDGKKQGVKNVMKEYGIETFEM